MNNSTPCTVDHLVEAYLRFKDWMDYDASHAAYCIREVMAMQKLFGTSYVEFPNTLYVDSYERLLAIMQDREDMLCRWTEIAETTADVDEMDRLARVLERTAPHVTVHYFTTLTEAVHEMVTTAEAIVAPDGSYTVEMEKGLSEDHFQASDDAYKWEIRKFIVSENPGIDGFQFPVSKLHDLGVPAIRPEPIGGPDSWV